MTETQIHLAIDGDKSGPYSTADMRAWLQSGEIPAHARCWMPGMKDWQIVTKVFPDVRPGQPVFVGGRSAYGPQDVGLGRLGYAVVLALLVIGPLGVLTLTSVLIITQTGDRWMPLGQALGPGMPVCALLLFVPLLGMLFHLSLFVLPPNYAATRRLDSSSWFVLTLVLFVLGDIILAAIQSRVFLNEWRRGVPSRISLSSRIHEEAQV